MKPSNFVLLSATVISFLSVAPSFAQGQSSFPFLAPLGFPIEQSQPTDAANLVILAHENGAIDGNYRECNERRQQATQNCLNRWTDAWMADTALQFCRRIVPKAY